MAKVGYIFSVAHDDRLAADKEWMQQYGCVQVVEEDSEHEKLRPQWHQLLARLERGDELVVSKLSNALRGVRELSALIELCRVKVVRIISLRDKIDTHDELFHDTKASHVMNVIGALPEEAALLRKASAHVLHLQQDVSATKKPLSDSERKERERTIVAMYNNNHSIDEIWRVSGFSSRSSVFRILGKYGVKLNRGKFSGPLGKRKKDGE